MDSQDKKIAAAVRELLPEQRWIQEQLRQKGEIMIPASDEKARILFHNLFYDTWQLVWETELALRAEFEYEIRGEGFSPGRGFTAKAAAKKVKTNRVAGQRFLVLRGRHAFYLVLGRKLQVLLEEGSRSPVELAVEAQRVRTEHHQLDLQQLRRAMTATTEGEFTALADTAAWVKTKAGRVNRKGGDPSVRERAGAASIYGEDSEGAMLAALASAVAAAGGEDFEDLGRCALSALRDERRHGPHGLPRGLLGAELDEWPDEDPSDPGFAAIQASDAVNVLRRELDDKEFRAIFLRHAEKKTHAEIAAALRIPPGSVGKLIDRAEKKAGRLLAIPLDG